MARAPDFRQIVYRLRPRGPGAPRQLPLVLARGLATLVVETRAAHLDRRGQVWRILSVRGAPEDLRAAEARFRAYAPRFVVEKSVLGRTRHTLHLWYKYRLAAGDAAVSHTALAFLLLGRDTLVTDHARDGELTLDLVARAGPGPRRFLAAVRARAAPEFDLDVLYVGPPRAFGAAALAPDEERALAVAVDLGYYDVPRRAGLRDLARTLRASPSAVGYRLRRAQATLARAYLAGARLA